MVPEEHLGSVLSDLSSQRRAEVKGVDVSKDTRVVQATAPLAELMVNVTHAHTHPPIHPHTHTPT